MMVNQGRALVLRLVPNITNVLLYAMNNSSLPDKEVEVLNDRCSYPTGSEYR
jgi:hypothetical protein